MNAVSSDPDGGRRGSVLILSLWVLFFLAALGMAIGSYVSANILQAQRLADRMTARYLAKAGCEQAAYLALNSTNAWDGLASDAWNNESSLFGDIDLDIGRFSVVYVTEPFAGTYTTNVGIIGESGKINVSDAPVEVIAALVELAGGLVTAEAEDIANAILDWRDPDDEMLTGGAENSYYSGLNPAYTCKNGRFQSVRELLLIKGIDEELLNRIAPYLTVFGSANVNLNVADQLVLESVARGSVRGGYSPDVCRSLARTIVAYRRAGNSFKVASGDTIRDNLDEFSQLSAEEKSVLSRMMPSVDITSSSFRGTARGYLGERENEDWRIEFVCDASTGDFVYWREM